MINPQDRYDAVLLCSYGGPRKPDDVLPFMRNATNGRGVPDERLLEVSGHYQRFHGISPINARTMELRQALEQELRGRGCELEVVVGNRNWTPFFHDVLCDLAMQGKKRVLCVFTSAYVSYSGCRQYREDLAKAQQMLAEQGLEIQLDKIRPYYTTQGFVSANETALRRAFATMCPQLDKVSNPAGQPGGAPSLAAAEETGGETSKALPYLVFVTHSVPTPMEEHSGPADKSRPSYSQQHLDLCAELARRLENHYGQAIQWELAYCSRSGPPQMPWLEPDVNDRLEALAENGINRVIAAPVGFICDHMEVVFDLDTEAKETAKNLGMDYYRADTVGTDPQFVQALADLVWQRAAEPTQPGELGRPAVAENTADTNGVASDDPEVSSRVVEVDKLDAFGPIWPAWPDANDSLASSRAKPLPVVCEQQAAGHKAIN